MAVVSKSSKQAALIMKKIEMFVRTNPAIAAEFRFSTTGKAVVKDHND